jgi:DNA-binding NarL/FixJ family response regulator
MRVLLVDDHRLLLEGLKGMLEAHGCQVAGVAMDGREAVTKAKTLKPDIILMDISMPVCDGLTATKLIKAEMPESTIIMLTTSTDDDSLFEAVKAGACGYLLKDMNVEELMEALDQAQQGVPPFAPGLAARLLAESSRLDTTEVGPPTDRIGGKAEPAVENPLTARQIEVLTLVAQGLSYREIGAQLYLSPRTIKYHMAEIIHQLHMRNRAQVLAYAGEMGLRDKAVDK